MVAACLLTTIPQRVMQVTIADHYMHKHKIFQVENNISIRGLGYKMMPIENQDPKLKIEEQANQIGQRLCTSLRSNDCRRRMAAAENQHPTCSLLLPTRADLLHCKTAPQPVGDPRQCNAAKAWNTQKDKIDSDLLPPESMSVGNPSIVYQKTILS